jgi:hypothetical protein
MLELVLGYWFWKKSKIIFEPGVKWLGGDSTESYQAKKLYEWDKI